MSSRANRRHHKNRMKDKAERVIRQFWGESDKGSIDFMRKCGDHIKMCSCSMCGNPRRNVWGSGSGKTRKELQEWRHE